MVGRNFPFPRQAVEALRAQLLKDGLNVLAIWPVEDAPGAICPWTAHATIEKRREAK